MSLSILDKDSNLITGPLVTNHNGFTGGQDEVLIYLKNQYAQYYYENVELSVSIEGELEEGDIFSTSGWSVKLSFGSEQPTEREWGDILVNSKIQIGNIGSSSVANTESFYPIWIRVFCPGHTEPQIKNNISISLVYSKKEVGS